MKNPKAVKIELKDLMFFKEDFQELPDSAIIIIDKGSLIFKKGNKRYIN